MLFVTHPAEVEAVRTGLVASPGQPDVPGSVPVA